MHQCTQVLVKYHTSTLLSAAAVTATLVDFSIPVVATRVVLLGASLRRGAARRLQQTKAGLLSTAAYRSHGLFVKMAVKPPPHDGPGHHWVDEQTQPLPRSVRHYLHGWIKAEELASNRWDAEVVIYEENDGGKMSVLDMQLSHAQVLLRSSFCRRVLSACFILERAEGLIAEHQWENFLCSFSPEGWRAKYHIYSPGTRPGGGPAHKPGLSKNGCYLVRLYYLGAWRCVWVSDQVPVDATDSPLLPFSPLLTRAPSHKPKQAPATVTSGVVFLWPLLLCKALLKLGAPDMNSDGESDVVDDERMPELNIFHALTGAMDLRYHVANAEALWTIITRDVQVFSWDDDDETQASTIKSRSTKKPTARDQSSVKRPGMTYIVLKDTKDLPPYFLPGITPGHEMCLLVSMVRDIPIKKPLPEPEVALWKYYRWVDWARSHGLYEAYDCPRTKFLKCNGLMKLSHAPHLLDVQSTESITLGFIEEQVKSGTAPGDEPRKKDKRMKELTKSAIQAANMAAQALKEELREWVQFDMVKQLVTDINVLYYPSMFQITTAGNNPPIRITKSTQRLADIIAPKATPLYLQIDGPEHNRLRLSLSSLHPRILANTGTTVVDYIESAYVVVERFEWFADTAVPIPKGFVMSRGYGTVEVDFLPGRHFCRLWTHSRMNWHITLISESSILLGTRDVIQGAAVRECSWASRFLLGLGTSFNNWIKVGRSTVNLALQSGDKEFFRSYLPDLEWDNKVVGYDRSMVHWMFRQALQSYLSKKLGEAEMKATSHVLRKFFCDPDFGFPKKPSPPRSVRELADMEICDCVIPEPEQVEVMEEQLGEVEQVEVKPLIEPQVMAKLLTPPVAPIASQVCELATENLPCGILKEEREKVVRQHEAATVIQAYWRGTWARNVLSSRAAFTPEVHKYVQENAFGTLDALSGLMNEFFRMYPGAKYAYSVASALSGVYGLAQHSGNTHVTAKCKWIPFFQGIFYCHSPVKVHFDVISSISHCSLAVYDNDTGNQLPQAYNTHITFDFHPNCLGYTVIGHGTLNKVSGTYFDAHWQLTVMSCVDGAFHICDNEDPCKEQPLPHASKLHIDEMFLPNRRNILGGIQISVTKHEAVSFRVSATSPDLEMEATLRTTNHHSNIEILKKCCGRGEIHWPFISLEPTPAHKSALASHSNVFDVTSNRSFHKAAKHKSTASSKNRSETKIAKSGPETKIYSIEVVCPMGWPLTLDQWKRVDEVRNSPDFAKVEPTVKKPGVKPEKQAPAKPGSAKEKVPKEEKEKAPAHFSHNPPQPGDAFVELEIAIALGGGASVKRDDDRDVEYTEAKKAWDFKEHGRNLRGAQLRKEFLTEFLVVPPPLKSESQVSTVEDVSIYFNLYNIIMLLGFCDNYMAQQGPSPVTESALMEISIESEEEATYLSMPDQLRDKFTPLYFLPMCMKDKNEHECILVTPDMAEAANKDRQARIQAAMERMLELQKYNEEHVLGRQKYRCQQLEKLCIDSHWCPAIEAVLEERDESIATEILNRTLSATRKKMEAKKLETKKVDSKRK
ncbi:unnamed protein product [Chrysodeixis includens]|uniref:Globin domain-containing protein n=1 Tax=Chrysodeixis includens TaxID=689277 RepID=A0A9P0BL92_CHRIL|nr:unnamed protein product [Chrysodeixis includens]